jgi:transcriptional regulator with XRE-family HTH domain
MPNARPGVALRKLRKRNHWTLAEVSKRTSIPSSTLSRIENDQISPTYDLLLRLSNGLSIDLSQLLSTAESPSEPEASRPGRRSINRVADGVCVQMPTHTLRYLSTDLLHKEMTPMVTEYHARSAAEFGEFMHHTGEEFLFVLEGEIELHTDSYAPVVLRAGESMYFDSTMGHAYIARGEGPCRALVINTVPRADERGTNTRTATGDAAAKNAVAVKSATLHRAKPVKRGSRRAA